MSVEKTKYGTWRARWRDAAGRQRARSFPRKQDAETFVAAQLTDQRRGHAVPNAGGLTVAQWADMWIAGARQLTTGGRETYQRDLNRYIIPELGDLPLERLTAEHIDGLLAAELTRGLAPSSVNRHYRTIHRMCRVAVDRGRLARNPCAKVEPPRARPTEMRFLTAKQVDQLADKIGDRYRAWVYLAAYGGLRWGEAIGLQRANIDGPRVTVATQLVRRADGRWERSEPKTKAGRRQVTLPGFAAKELAAHLEERVPPHPDSIVFANQAGRPLISQSFRTNVFKPALVRAGIDEQVRIHDLRHTAVALAVAAGAHPKAIQARMGHASIAVTLDRYGHLFEGIDDDLAKRLDKLKRK
jgi:integrase